MMACVADGLSMSGSSSKTIGSVFEAMGTSIPWEQLIVWPPDIFAVTELLLVQADAYRFVSSPPTGATWPPHDRWTESVRGEGKKWAEAAGSGERPGSVVLLDRWKTLSNSRGVSLDVLSRGNPWNVCEAIITLHALADEACSSLHEINEDGSPFAKRAWPMLEREGSLARFRPSQIRVLPKTHVPAVGITPRSLARHLSAHTSPVEVNWRRMLFPSLSPGASAETTYRILLLPWPLTVDANDFHPFRGALKMQSDEFGFFEFDSHIPIDLDYVRGALEATQGEGGASIVVLPESSVAEREVPLLERTVSDFGVISLVAGVRGAVDPATGFGRNYAHIGIRTGDGWIRYEQDKHHRWLLDGRQIRQYHLESSLDPRRSWWEAIEVPRYRIEIFDFGRGATTAALICEDLARSDDVAEIIRRIGPTTVFALLLDGPQISSRWSSRYASVLADDPGCTVIAMTSLGMATRSGGTGATPSRSIALWKDPERGLQEIELSPSADAVLLIASENWETTWTADGRQHDAGIPRLVLEEIRQLRLGGPNGAA